MPEINQLSVFDLLDSQEHNSPLVEQVRGIKKEFSSVKLKQDKNGYGVEVKLSHLSEASARDVVRILQPWLD